MLIATQLNVPVENIIGVAAHESQWGQGRIARECNNYFSMHAPAPLQIKTVPVLRDPKVKVAVYASFFQGGQSFAMRWGNAVRGISDPLKFAQALVQTGYNSSSSKNGGTDGYAQKLADIINVVRVRAQCPVR